MTTTTDTATLPANVTLGTVELAVSELDRAVDFYRDSLGLRVLRHDPSEAILGSDGAGVLALVEQPGALPAGRHAGLYHVALLYPSRLELARVAQRLLIRRTPIQGASDHQTHEAIYLADPDGNGLELAADRPRELWPAPDGPGGVIGGRPLPLDMESLLALVGDDPVPAFVEPGLRVGHVHLHVGEIERAIEFYCDVVGFELQANLGSAAFVSAGGYHHHLGFNVWRGADVGPAPAPTVGLRHWTVQLADDAQLQEVRARLDRAGVDVQAVRSGFLVRDPWENALLFELASS
jgi:catechol 2,3-dioxygenase